MLLRYGEQHVVPGEYDKYTEEAKHVLLLAKETALSYQDASIEVPRASRRIVLQLPGL
jgi:hypothetical protein